MNYFKSTLIAICISYAHMASAADSDYTINIKNHKFEPQELTIPAGQKVALKVTNQDATPEEFESYELKREKIIGGNSTATILIGPLDAGVYPFFGEFNPKTAQGKIIVK